MQQHNFVGQSHGLDLIVRDVNHAGRVHVFVQLGNFQTCLHAQGSVQVGQRLIKQKQLRLFHNGTPNGYALTLTTRQSFGQSVEQGCELQNIGRSFDFAFNLRFV